MSTSGTSSLPKTPVRKSVSGLIPELEHVEINNARLKEEAEKLATDEFALPEWRAPVFPDETAAGVTAGDVIDFLFIGNTINFQFRHYDSGGKFVAEYAGADWEGAFGMWACLKRRFDDDKDILRGEKLAGLSIKDVKTLFESADGTQIPMLDERHQILKSAGHTLEKYYNGQFRNLVESADSRLYSDGDGIVDKLISDFESFRDSNIVRLSGGASYEVNFWKRAQLAPGMAYGRFHSTESFRIADPKAFTVFVDYNLPNILRGIGVIEYSSHLADLVDRRQMLEPGSREEVEIRAATVYATDELIELINNKRTTPIYAPHMDYKLFNMRDKVSTPVHLTRTTAY